ncbi:Putative uncharacterized protein [Taphrina deformans PYCC 5710]|uniref:GDP/GTP exchange factor Sec2 N-terminal domain-containing protein n=1 Tax=Taphrina deformans (strain PYCC 5710 / ATCC 11124 / CBS 356.35 / IMI 108563 / JCM 9778 / NBRC 8474) TaxID=1097556 RepID=R4XDB3_TAPDE|nr:Putative uncharacterized protein [Taphrina deformans PYCC 5710]|eukprot:CCG81329.1 Putative uncharacterized protein [Taphrina deformans PYCC 5710]
MMKLQSESYAKISGQYTDYKSLNAKLVTAIEKRAELEDNVASIKHELDLARARIEVLESAQEEHNQMVASGLLLEKKDVDLGNETLAKELSLERDHRLSAEGSRKEIEKELEDLTSSLFEEANKMVAVERIENAALRERNEHLTTRLTDNEILLASQQAQLEELKLVMQKMSDREELNDSRPASPNPNKRHSHKYSRDSMKGLRTPLSGTFPSPFTQQLEAISITQDEPQLAETVATVNDPEDFSGMLMPRYRTDIVAYEDFLLLLHQPKVSRPTVSRVVSASSLAPEADQYTKDAIAARSPHMSVSRASSPSLERSMSTAGTLWTRYADSAEMKKDLPLRDTKFLKRALIEDIEPTLRLDQGPELGYLSRRSILNAVIEGHLIVEPMPAHLARYKPDRYPCALCGDARYTDEIKRNYRLKTSEKIDSQPYPLCNWCTDRVRSVCTYVAFLKQVKDGLWKASTESEEMRVWEESVKLRESMFWSRVGHIVDM